MYMYVYMRNQDTLRRSGLQEQDGMSGQDMRTGMRLHKQPQRKGLHE